MPQLVKSTRHKANSVTIGTTNLRFSHVAHKGGVTLTASQSHGQSNHLVMSKWLFRRGLVLWFGQRQSLSESGGESNRMIGSGIRFSLLRRINTRGYVRFERM